MGDPKDSLISFSAGTDEFGREPLYKMTHKLKALILNLKILLSTNSHMQLGKVANLASQQGSLPRKRLDCSIKLEKPSAKVLKPANVKPTKISIKTLDLTALQIIPGRGSARICDWVGNRPALSFIGTAGCVERYGLSDNHNGYVSVSQCRHLIHWAALMMNIIKKYLILLVL